MSLLFSHVRLTSDTGSYTEFLCGGIPDSEDDLAGWIAYEEFLDSNYNSQEIQAEVESFLYGDGEAVHADENEVAYLTLRLEKDDWFIEHHCDYVSDSRFSFSPANVDMETFDWLSM